MGVRQVHKRRLPGRCPVCDDELTVVRLRCDTCGTGIDGSFELPQFARLSREQLEFVEVFLRARGNIKEVERELGISYPTVRSRLDAVLETLGYRVDSRAVSEEAQLRARRRKEILDALGRGDLSPEEAVQQLKQL